MGNLAYRNEGPFNEIAGETMVADRLVLLSTGKVMYADAGEEPIGLTTAPVANGEQVACYPLRGGVEVVTAAGVITEGSALYCAGDGTVSDAAVGKQIGIARTASGAAGGKIAAIMWGPRGGNDLLTGQMQVVNYLDDFFQYDATGTVGNWVAVSDGGTIVQTDAAGGVLSLPTGATDNNESYISSVAEIFKFQTNKRLYFEARVKLSEAAVNAANIIVGLSNTVAADSLLDNGAGPMASYVGAVFFKVDGGVVWQFETSNAGAQVTTASAGAFTTNTWYTLAFLYDFNDGVTGKVTPFINGVKGTVHSITIAGCDEMHILLGAKAGGNNAETLLVDYVKVAMER